jgi:hypothetical protein
MCSPRSRSGNLRGSTSSFTPLAVCRSLRVDGLLNVKAQKLLFGFSQEGDMLPLISGHFDTVFPGSKIEVVVRSFV